MSRPTIVQIRELGDFATLYQWNLYVVKAPPAVGGFPVTEDLNLRCESAEIPKVTFPPIPIEVRGHKIHQPGAADYTNTWTLTFVETVDNMIADMIYDWHQKVWEVKTGKHEKRLDVEGTFKLERLDRQNEPIWTYTLYGAYIESYEQGILAATSENMKPSITISFDYFDENA